MKLSKLFLVAIFVWGQLSVRLPAQSNEAQIDNEQELRNLEKEWDAAIVARDIPTLNGILSDDFEFIDSAGSVHSKPDILEGIKNSKATTKPFETKDVHVRIYGTTAILTGRFTQMAVYEGKEYSGQFRYTDVYVKQGNSWRAVSAHASRMPDEKK